MLVFPGKQYKKVRMAHEGSAIIKESQSLEAHFQRIKCVDLIAKRYYWLGMINDVPKYQASCHRHETIKSTKLQEADNVLHPILVPTNSMKPDWHQYYRSICLHGKQPLCSDCCTLLF